MEKTVNSADISLAAAQRLIRFAVEYAEQKKINLAVAVVDRSGNPVAFARTDHAVLAAVEAALDKAKTAAYLKSSSKRLEERVNRGEMSLTAISGLLPMQGGVPLIYQGRVVGAVGISGTTGEGNNRLAEMMAAAFSG